jgi:hypothetical protein
MKSKLEFYALAVCFTAVICLIISIGIAGYSIVSIANPELTMSSREYNKYQTNDSFWKSEHSVKDARSTEEEITNKRQEAQQVALKAEKRQGMQSLIQTMMFVMIGSVTLLIHWKIAKHARA